MQFQDYYQTLGVQRSASPDEVKKAYKKLARKYHPDVSKESNAAEKFKEINEAYEVLGDDDKRKRYDSLGANWKNGQDFQPPPNWEEMFGNRFGGGGAQSFGGAGNGASFHFGGDAGFSDFFESFFGDQDFQRVVRGGFAEEAGYSQGARRPQGTPGGRPVPKSRKGQDLEASVRVGLYEALSGTTKKVSFDLITTSPDGERSTEKKSYNVKIPAGIQPGKSIRLTGQGAPGINSGKDGDLLLRVLITEDPRFTIMGRNLISELKLTPWEAALGTELPVETLDSQVNLRVPAGTQSGQKLRVKGKGYSDKKGERGDLLLQVKVCVPKELSDSERELYEEFKERSSFNPRGEDPEKSENLPRKRQFVLR